MAESQSTRIAPSLLRHIAFPPFTARAIAAARMQKRSESPSNVDRTTADADFVLEGEGPAMMGTIVRKRSFDRM